MKWMIFGLMFLTLGLGACNKRCNCPKVELDHNNSHAQKIVERSV